VKYLLIALVAFLSFKADALSYTKVFTEPELQQKLDKLMPVEKKKFFVTVVVANPQLSLASSDDRLTLKVDIKASLLGGVKGNGAATVNSGIRYDNQLGAFYLNEPKLIALELNGAPTNIQPKIQKLVQKLVANALVKKPIFTFDESDMKHKLAKSSIKEIRIEDKQLLVELSWF